MSTPFDTSYARPGASPAQLRFISNLLAERAWYDAAMPKYVERAAAISTAINLAEFHDGMEVNNLLGASGQDVLTQPGASALIDWLLDQPEVPAAKPEPARRNASVPSVDEVPAGRYAVVTNAGAVNELAFYKIDRPTEGRWAGFMFVKHLVGDGEQRMSKHAGDAIARKIAEVGAAEASAAYGREIGRCGVCGRTLTNDDSRARGIGPVCAEGMGW